METAKSAARRGRYEGSSYTDIMKGSSAVSRKGVETWSADPPEKYNHSRATVIDKGPGAIVYPNCWLGALISLSQSI